MERALEQHIPLWGEDHPRKPPPEVGALRSRGTLHPGAGWGGKD